MKRIRKIRKILYTLFAGALVLTGGSFAFASAGDWHFNLQDSMNSPTTLDAAPSIYVTSLLGNDITHGGPAFYYTDGVSLVFDDVNHNLSIGTIQPSQVDTLPASLSSLDSRITATEAANTSEDASISGLSTNATPSVPGRMSSSDKSKLNSMSPVLYYNNGAQATSTVKRLTFNGTTTSGSATFYLTDDGTVTGNALCTTVNHTNVIMNDPSNNFGVGYAITNSNKTLTVTANTRSFTSTTILGISVLGASSLTATANGTPLSVLVDCN